MAENVKAEVLKRFNHNDPGAVIEVAPDNFEKWQAMGLVKKAGKASAKAAEGPPSDKAVKEPEKKK